MPVGGTNPQETIILSQASTQDQSQALNTEDNLTTSQASQSSEATRKRKRVPRAKKQEVPSSTAGMESQGDNQLMVSESKTFWANCHVGNLS